MAEVESPQIVGTAALLASLYAKRASGLLHYDPTMGILGRRANVEEDGNYMPEVRLINPAMGSKELQLVQWICQRVPALMEGRFEHYLDQPQVDALLRALIPVTQAFGGFPSNPDDVAYDFVMGWVVAEAEAEAGWARPGMISAGAAMSLSLLRPSPEADGFAPAMWTFFDLGYTTHRLEATPEDAVDAVLRP